MFLNSGGRSGCSDPEVLDGADSLKCAKERRRRAPRNDFESQDLREFGG